MVVIGIWAAFNFLFFYPATNGLGKGFNVVIMYMITAYIALVSGVLMLFLRLLRILKNNNSVVYILVGVLNAVAGILTVVLYMSHNVDLSWLNKCLLNLLAGFLILTDVFILNNRK